MAVGDGGSISVEDGWMLIDEKGFKPLARVLDKGADYRTRHGGEGPQAWNEIYTTVYKMCVQKKPKTFAEELYERVQLTLRYYLQTTSLPAMHAKHGEFMLSELNRRWTNHKLMVKWVKRTFSYVDRYYVKRNDKPSLEMVGFRVFKTEVFDALKNDVRTAILDLIKKERDGETVDRSLLKQVLGLFAEMGMGHLEVYIEDFEKPFLEATAQFYRLAAAAWAEEDSFPAFLLKADKALTEEATRAREYLHPRTPELLLRVIEQEVLVRHQQAMLEKENSGLIALLENNKYDSLQRMFQLYSRMNEGLPPIGAIFRNHMRKEGMELVRLQRSRVESARATAASQGMSSNAFTKQELASGKPEYIHSLLDLHDHYMRLVQTCFASHSVFTKAMKDAFERFVNEQVGDTSTAMLFANYCDSLLSVGGLGSKMMDNDVESALDKLVMLFSYLAEKDLFQEFCRKQLAKRLLLDRSHSDDAERFLISKLKQRCGSHFTSKLEGMITDMRLSKDFQDRFVRSLGQGDEISSMGSVAMIGDTEYTVRVLTTGHWPTYQEDKSLVLPSPLMTCIKAYENFYHSDTSQRVLRWVHSLGKGSLETSLYVARRPYQKIEIQASTHQMCILLLFNQAEALTFGRIKQKLQSEDVDTIKSSLMSLTKKYPVLTKTPRSKEFHDSDVFAINFRFSSPKRRITIPMPAAKISEEEKEAAHESVIEDRRHAIEAAIVRVMKKHKTLSHQMLVMGVSTLCNPVFRPEPRAIKNRIEMLIAREYLARDEKESSTYRYLA